MSVEYIYEGKTIRFYNQWEEGLKPTTMNEVRLSNIEKKEPYTIEWINTFKEGELFYDVGANVGVYTIYATVVKDVSVVAFEPEHVNYCMLQRNIYLNKAVNAVAYCTAMSDKVGHGYLVTRLGVDYQHEHGQTGIANNQFTTGDTNIYNLSNPPPKHGCLSSTLDQFPPPTHLKIDVDGIEKKVIDGAMETLKSEKLKSINIEIDSLNPDHELIPDILVGNGFTNQVRHPAVLTPTSSNLICHRGD